MIEMLEAQDGGLDIFARHFFASLPPAADVSQLTRRPSEEEWAEMVKKSAQTGFYRVIQDPPFNFTLHAVPLRFAEIKCRDRMRYAYFKCLEAHNEELKCSLSLDPEECYKCDKKFLFKYEKGVDVALAADLVIFGTAKTTGLDRIILVAGDGDYKEAIRFVRREVGKDIQIVSWRKALSSELEKLANKQTIILDDRWESLCEVREKPPLEESPAAETDEAEDEE
ncbi:MAG: NYN domain-containing protein [Proteobacteria bacterium]|nr:NYN domain-containing protein [Pseudomonadota bacterium]